MKMNGREAADAFGPPGGIARRLVLQVMASVAMLPFVGLRAHTPGDKWRSSEAVHSPASRGRPSGSPERCVSIRSSTGLFQAAGATVTFEPEARTAWHTHPLGQTLIVISGAGKAQRWGAPIEDIRPGDVVWIPPGEKHWHGASPTTAMTHIAIQEKLDGKAVDWLEHVTAEQYRG
jgi:quercetin dioxygenase-like cupin family protein